MLMTKTQKEKAETFKALHEREGAFIIPNPWDAGSARLLAGLGFEALATTSAGFANSLGRLDGEVTRDEVIEHCRDLCAASELPVSADLENCFADDPERAAETILLGAGPVSSAARSRITAATPRIRSMNSHSRSSVSMPPPRRHAHSIFPSP